MTLLKIKSAPIVLLEDDKEINTLPIILELVQREKNTLNFFCYEQPVLNWKNVFKKNSNMCDVMFYQEYDPELYEEYINGQCSVFVDSVNQMALSLGWNKCYKNIKKLLLDSKVTQVILVLHKDCLPHLSKLHIHLEHVASAVVSYNNKSPCRIKFQLKKSGKVVKTEENLFYDNITSTLKSSPIVKEEIKDDKQEKPVPGNLSTFKIEVEQTEKLEKYKLKLPYMSKINEGESKVYYEPDAVDDWDEEDPDEDLEI